MKKICTKCLLEKDINHFHKNKNSKDGMVSQCKICRKLKSKNDYKNNKLLKKLNITGKTCSTCQLFKDIDEFHRQIGAKDGYRSICKKCRTDDFKIKYHKSPDSHREKTKKYRINNQNKINIYFKNRYIKKPHEYAWRGMLNSVIRRFGGKKEGSTYQILGYSAAELKEHMEKLFVDGMTWDNWGKWHIDHITPISKFEKNTDPKIVNSLDNLQPLWMEDNIRKSNN